MKTASPSLLPLLRSRSQGDVAAAILLDPEHVRSVSELAAELDLSPATVMREVDRLEAGGIITSVRRGNSRLITPVTDSPLYRPLAELLAVTFGPLPVLRNALADVPGIERAFIYGSWAARYHQREGRVPADIDLLVIGDVDRHALDTALAGAEHQLRREVNARRVTAEIWEGDDSAFKRTVTSRPVVDVIGNSDD